MAIDISIVLIISSFIISLYVIVNRKRKGTESLHLPPGPRKLPIIGNLHQIDLALPHRGFLDVAKKYGPIMSVQIGQVPMIVISSPKLAEEALKTNDLAIASRPYLKIADLVMYGGIDVVFGRYGDYWRQMKKLMTTELLSVKKVQSFMVVRKQEIDGLMETIRSRCGEPVRLYRMLTKVNNTIICKSLFGNNCRQQDDLIEAMDEVTLLGSSFLIVDLFPKLGFLSGLSGTNTKLKNLHKKIDNMYNEIFEDRRIKRKTTGTLEDDLTDVLFNLKEQGGLRFPITDNNIKAIFTNLIIGGTDTSALTVSWAMTELMRNPHIMKKAQTEVREAFKGEKSVIETELHKLVYIKLIIKETLRLHHTTPLLLPRECREQCQIGGYDIPVKMRIVINAFACGIDPESWDDPETFRPERFEKSSHDFYGTNFDYIPFGAGRRMCPGITFGLANVEQTFAKLLFHFNWQLPDGMQPKDIDMSENFGGTLTKKEPLEVIPTLHIPY
ncbi:hypothetical protein LXL04_017480 [Taraxacum kok-saghyz]